MEFIKLLHCEGGICLFKDFAIGLNGIFIKRNYKNACNNNREIIIEYNRLQRTVCYCLLDIIPNHKKNNQNQPYQIYCIGSKKINSSVVQYQV